jgi:2-keto-4-pentenoate hydratase/2-oxohepta-3-ene-1,7-dioic acid hydratase in catechol pathway
MKLLTFIRHGIPSPGLALEDGRILDLAESARGGDHRFDTASVLGLIDGGDAAVAWMNELLAEAAFRSVATVAAHEVTIVAPIPRPLKNVFCIGRNYVDHIKEGERAQAVEIKLPEVPQIFTKPPTAVIGPTADVRLDDNVTKRLDYEVELAVVIGKPGRDIPASAAFDHVFGYTVLNDITARDLQRRHDQWFKGKGLDTSCPTGPWIVHKSLIPDPTVLRLTSLVNGEKRQEATVSQMIFDIPAIIQSLSAGLTLEAGDIIATGTPSGVGYAMDPPQYLKPGDIVECTIDGIGSLRNRIVAA